MKLKVIRLRLAPRGGGCLPDHTPTVVPQFNVTSLGRVEVRGNVQGRVARSRRQLELPVEEYYSYSKGNCLTLALHKVLHMLQHHAAMVCSCRMAEYPIWSTSSLGAAASGTSLHACSLKLMNGHVCCHLDHA